MTKSRSPGASARRRPRSNEPRELVWTSRALADLEAICDYIARDRPVAAERWVAELMAVAERAGALPLSGRAVPEFGRDDIRELIKKTYRVVYRVTQARVEVLTVLKVIASFRSR